MVTKVSEPLAIDLGMKSCPGLGGVWLSETRVVLNGT